MVVCPAGLTGFDGRIHIANAEESAHLFNGQNTQGKETPSPFYATVGSLQSQLALA